MKVLFIYPQVVEHGDIPIALTLLTAVLCHKGHEVRVFDCSRYVPVIDMNATKEGLGMFKAAPTPPVAPPPRKKIENIHQDLINELESFKPGLVGITATTATYKLGLECCRVVKAHNKDILTVFGGIHPTICPEEAIADHTVDSLCIGEGEDALLELCDNLQAKKGIYDIANLWIRDRENPSIIHKNPLRPLRDLNTLPVQDFSGFHEYEFYRPLDGKMYKMLNTELSRGCVFKCHYCSNHFLQDLFAGLGSYHRRKDPAVAVAHLKQLKEKYQFDAIRFWDEDFTVFSPSYLKELCRLYKKEVSLPFVVYAGTRTVTEEKVAYLKEMGCITMAMAIESGNYWVRKYLLNRDITDEDIIKKYDIVKKSGIRVSAYNMIGFPFETRKMIFDTIYLNRKVKPATSSVAAYMLYPKTRLAEITREFGFLSGSPDYGDFTASIDSPFISKAEINGLIRTFSLYTKIPRKLFALLKKCEKDESVSREIFPVILKHLADADMAHNPEINQLMAKYGLAK